MSRVAKCPNVAAACAVLEEWRAAERRLYEARAALERVVDQADRRRDEHRRAFAGQR